MPIKLYSCILRIDHIFVTSLPSLPQLSHTDTVISLLLSAVLMLFSILFILHTPSSLNFDALSLKLSDVMFVPVDIVLSVPASLVVLLLLDMFLLLIPIDCIVS